MCMSSRMHIHRDGAWHSLIAVQNAEEDLFTSVEDERTCVVIPFTVMTYTVIAYIVMAYIVMACIDIGRRRAYVVCVVHVRARTWR